MRLDSGGHHQIPSCSRSTVSRSRMKRLTLRMRPLAVAAVVCATTASLLVASPAFAAEDDSVAQGDDWTVNEVAGGYEVVKTLDAPLELTASVPTLWVDGVEIGMAKESADGLALSVTTTDPAIAKAKDVEQGWA